jgi:hypothetical protein
MPSPRIIRHDSDDWSWEFVSCDPHPLLRPFVRSYTGFRERSASHVRRIESATDDIVLVFNFGPRMKIIDPRDPRSGDQTFNSFAAGLYDSYVLTEMAEVSHGLEVKFSPVGARLFFGVPMSEFANRIVSITDFSGGDLIEEELEAERTWTARFQKLDRVLKERFSRAQPFSLLSGSP